MTEEQAPYDAGDEAAEAMEMLGTGYRKHISDKAGKYLVERDRVIAFKRIYMDVMGDAEGALWLSQLAYWSPLAKRNDGYVYKPYEEWERETGLSKRQVKRVSDTA